jgi:nuclear migration protein JNM1
MPTQVDARDVDFSDRLTGKRKSYKTSSRRQRVLEDGTEQIGDLSDEDDGEDLERKIARLKREVQEAKEEYRKREAETGSSQAGEEDKFASLSLALDEMSLLPKSGTFQTTSATKTASATSEEVSAQVPVSVDGATYTVTYAPEYEQSHALAKAADFDRRLELLEKSIGITSSDLPELDGNSLPRAIIPTLDTLQRQIITLSEASTSSLDSISRRVRTLTQEAEQLEKSRKAAKAAQESLVAAGDVAGETGSLGDSEQTAKINALYGTLPTIENMAPLLPPLLDRLRSLRAIHSDAATASETLERIEESQNEMAADIKQWRDGLGKIESAMKDGDEAMDANTKVIEGWVKALETKVSMMS